MRNLKKLSTPFLIASAACIVLSGCTYQKGSSGTGTDAESQGMSEAIGIGSDLSGIALAPSSVASGSAAAPSSVASGSDAAPSSVASGSDAAPSSVASGSDAAPSSVASGSAAAPSSVASGSDAAPSSVASGSAAASSSVASGSDAASSSVASGSDAASSSVASGSDAASSSVASGSDAASSNVASGSDAAPSSVASGSDAAPSSVASGSAAASSKVASGSDAASSSVASGSDAASSSVASGSDAAPSNVASNTKVTDTIENVLAANISMQSPVFDLGSPALSAAVNNAIVTQNTTLLQQYSAAYSAVDIKYENSFIDSNNILYVSFIANYQTAETPATGVKHFSRNYDLSNGGNAIRIVGRLYSAQDIASALLEQDLDSHHQSGQVEASMWNSQKAYLKSNDVATLTTQLATADFGSDNLLATITITRTSNDTLTVYYPVPHSIGDYAVFTIGVL